MASISASYGTFTTLPASSQSNSPLLFRLRPMHARKLFIIFLCFLLFILIVYLFARGCKMKSANTTKDFSSTLPLDRSFNDAMVTLAGIFQGSDNAVSTNSPLDPKDVKPPTNMFNLGREGDIHFSSKETGTNIASYKEAIHDSDYPSYAFASLLCDDAMIEPALVLVSSMRATKSPYPHLFLLLPSVSAHAEFSLSHFGATCLRIDMLDYPFPVNAEKIAINKMCRYSKLHLWSLIEFEKIAYIDVDTILVKNIDDVFQFPEFTAVKDAGDTYNTGLFVLEPSIDTYNQMLHSYLHSPSYNHGDQGFLNYFFQNKTKEALPIKYNTMIKNKIFTQWDKIVSEARLIHYTSETKPWNFYYAYHKNWKENMDPIVFYIWNKGYERIARSIKNLTIDIETTDNQKETVVTLIDLIKDPLENTTKINEMTDETIAHCDLFQSSTLTKTSPFLNDLSIIIYKFVNKTHLELMIRTYSQIPFVYEIYLWYPLMEEKNMSYKQVLMDRFPKLRIIDIDDLSPDVKYRPILSMTSKCIFLTNGDSTILSKSSMELGFTVWKNHPYSLVGFNPFRNLWSPFESQYQPSMVDETFSNVGKYSFLSSNNLFLAKDYLYVYSCLLPFSMHHIINSYSEECSDLAMNMLVWGMTSSNPVALISQFQNVTSIAQPQSMSVREKDKRKKERDINSINCLSSLTTFFKMKWDETHSHPKMNGNIIRSNQYMYSRIKNIPFRKMEFSRWKARQSRLNRQKEKRMHK